MKNLKALKAFILTCKSKQFAYGSNDCALFSAGAVMAMTGKDLAKGFRGYKTHAGGMKKLRAEGYSDHIDYAASVLDEVNVNRASAGDVVVIDAPEGHVLGILQGKKLAYVMTPNGVGTVPREKVIRAFKV